MPGELRSGPRRFYLFCFLFLAVLPGTAAIADSGQTDDARIEWIAVYAGVGHGNDYTLDMAVTGAGSIYPAGFSFDSASDDAYLVMKYDPAGVLEWDRRVTSTGNDKDKANAVAVDDNDSVIVTGYMTAIGGDRNLVTIKYDPAGSLEWMRTYAGGDGMDDEGLDLATDDQGNVYVTGYTQSAASGYDYVTLKYNSAGVWQWTDVYSGLLTWEDKARAIAVAGDGACWVTGGSEGLGSGQDYLTLRYDEDGNRQWTRRYNGPGNDDDVAYGLVDFAGEILLTGSATAASGESTIVTLHYDSEGNLAWDAGFASPSNDGAVGRRVAVDDNGDVFVVGYFFLGGAGETDYVTIKYDFGGDELWHQYYDSPRTPSLDEAAALTLDPDGNVYVTGYAQGNDGDYDYVTIQYDPEGDGLWSARYDGVAGGNDVATSIAADSEGNVYVSGYSWGGAAEQYDAVTVKYCRGCLIDDACFADGEENPANVCLICDPSASETGWSNNNGVACDDGLYCTGDDFCSGGACSIHAGDPCGDDGQFCNGDEYCDEQGDRCLHAGNPCVDDGQFCNGDELCNEGDDRCESTGDPCADDGLFCTGDEFCDETNDQCGATGDPCSDDGLFCNGAESCDEGQDACVSAGDPCADDGLFCNGVESCDEESDDCVSSGNPCPDDGVFCNGAESCNEESDGCESAGDPCVDDGAYCNGIESCDEEAGACVSSGDPCEDNGQFCDGEEFCDETNDVCGHLGNPCDPEKSCDETNDECVPESDDDDSTDDDDAGSDPDQTFDNDEEDGDASGGGCCNC